MKTRQTIIATSVAALLISGNAFAKEAHELHEHLWSQIKSYGQVLVEEDSVDNWGPWADFVEPAAGGPSPVPLLGAGGSDAYKNIPNTIPPETITETGCSAGSWCGYAIFRDKASKSGGDYPTVMARESVKSKAQWNAGLFSLTFVADTEITAGSGHGDGSVFWRLSSLDSLVNPNFTDSGTEIPVYFGGRKGDRDNGLHHFHTIYPEMDTLVYSDSTDSASASAFSHQRSTSEARHGLHGTGPFEKAVAAKYYDTASERWYKNDEVAVGKFMRQVESYTSGEYGLYSEGGSSRSLTSTDGYYVVGVATPLTYLADQQSRDIRAYYSGGSFDGSRQGSVVIEVKFGPATWNGYWSSMGKGTFGFEASGTITGANINSTSITSDRGIAAPSSYVQGTFYGQTAGSIGGVSSVTVTQTPSVEARIALPTTQTQTQNAIFLVNKVDNIKK